MPAYPSAGTTISIGAATDAPTTLHAMDTFTVVGEVLSISGPEMSRGEIDTTALSDSAKRSIADVLDNGTITMSLNFDGRDTSQQKMFTDAQSAGNVRNMRIVVSDGTQFEFVAFVTNISHAFSTGAQVTRDVSFRISGPVTVINPT